MYHRLMSLSVVLVAGIFVSSATLAEVGRKTVPGQAADTRPFDSRELSGLWWGDLYAFGLDVPPFTPEGQKRFDANKPAYGSTLGSADAAASTNHVGRRRAIPPALGNDPVGQCNPLGLMRLLLYSPAPIEIVQTPDRIFNFFEWTWDHRGIWMDGRQLPDVDAYIPRYNGYSVGTWEGDNLVVTTIGFDDRQWIDHFGYPVSDQARLEERWRRADYNTLELSMTLTDPVIYTTPWVSDLATFTMVPTELLTTDDWTGLVEDRCVPADEVNEFNRRVRDPAGGIFH